MKALKGQKRTKEEVQNLIPEWKNKGEKEIRVVFKNLEHPGQAHTFCGGHRYPGDIIETLTLRDGERRSLSIDWINHINGCCTTEFQDAPGGIGGQIGVAAMMPADGAIPGQTPMPRIARLVPRFACLPLEYSDDIDTGPSTLFTPIEDTTSKEIIL